MTTSQPQPSKPQPGPRPETLVAVRRAQAERNLKWFLRILGTVELLAIGAVVMPRGWMDAVHRGLGMGPLPEGPIVEYLARSTSMFYAAVGAVVWWLSLDVRRFGRAITVLGAAMVAAGPLMFCIDLTAGMPCWWTAQEGLAILALGVITLVLRFRVR